MERKAGGKEGGRETGCGGDTVGLKINLHIPATGRAAAFLTLQREWTNRAVRVVEALSSCFFLKRMWWV